MNGDKHHCGNACPGCKWDIHSFAKASNGIPALVAEKSKAAEEAGVLAMDLVRRNVKPSEIITREAIES